MHNSATDWRWARLQSKTPQARKQALLTTLSSSSRCESAAEHDTAEQYSKTGRTKLQNDLRRSDRSWNTCQDCLMIPSLWNRGGITGNRAKVLLKGHLSIKRYPKYNKVSRLLQHSSIYSQWGQLRMNCAWPGDYYSLSLTSIQFHPNSSHHTLTLFRSRSIDSETANLSPADGTTATRVKSSA